MFCLHPYFSKQKEDFISNESFALEIQCNYSNLIKKASLLITDYSSIFFDFAYLKKPIIYYQYGDDYHFGSDPVFDEDAANFGDIISDEEDLLNKIIEYIENDCLMEDEYKNKVDKFFKYTDKNNCKRVYEFILEDEGWVKRDKWLIKRIVNQ